DITTPWGAPANSQGQIDGSATEIYSLDREIPSIVGTMAYNAGQVTANVKIQASADPRAELSLATVDGGGQVGAEARRLTVSRLTLSLGQRPAWQLTNASPTSAITWNDEGITVAPLEFADVASSSQRASISGTWRADGGGVLQLSARQLSIDAWT